ncbi:MAG: hypothetical protein ACJAXA_000104, partial [Candidatus Aldehydirespiratoraceae bacterium]
LGELSIEFRATNAAGSVVAGNRYTTAVTLSPD